MMTWPDVEQISLAPSSLAALAKLTAIANQRVLASDLPDESTLTGQRDAVFLQIRMLEDLSRLPAATGELGQQKCH